MTPDINVLVAACRADPLRRLCLDGKLTGNSIPDAWIAAAVKVMNGRLVTFDRGFTRLLGKGELTLLQV
jgi:predicted nucleic acid-binding protein